MLQRFDVGAILGWIACTSLLLFSGAAMADLRDPAAWNVLITQEGIGDSAVWGDLIAAADDGGGLFFFDPGALSLESVTTREGLTSNRVSGFAVDDGGDLWIATRGGGIVRMAPDRSVRSVVQLVDLDVTAVSADGQFVYYGTSDGAGFISSGSPAATFTEEDGLVDDNVVAVAARDGVAWFGTPVGVSSFSRAGNVLVTRNDGLAAAPDRQVRDILATARGVFVATATDVYLFDDNTETWILAAAGLAEPVLSLSELGNDILALGEGSRAFRLPDGATTWTTLALDTTNRDFQTVVGGPDGQVWYGGSLLNPQAMRNDPRAMLWREGLAEPVAARGLFGDGPRGVAPDGEGGFWIGTFPIRGGLTHWRSDGELVAYNLQDEGDGIGWGSSGPKIAVLRASNGDVWVSDLGNGVTRMRPHPSDDPALAEYLDFDAAQGLLRANSVLRMSEDSNGRIWFANNGGGADLVIDKGIDILLDQDNPLDANSWLKMTTGNSMLASDEIKGIDFQGDTVVWISGTGGGVQRFLHDGFQGTGSQRESSFQVGARWDTLTDVGGTNLTDPRGVAVTNTGLIWAASNGSGLVRFRYNVGGTPDQILRVRETSFGPSLLSGQVRDLVLDSSNDLWAVTDAGLNRVVEDAVDLRVDSWTDFVAFESRNLNFEFISPMPGSNAQTLAYDPASNRLVVATQTGAAVLSIGALAPAPAEALEFSLYPNPYRGDSTRLRVTGFTGLADVEIYNLSGVLMVSRPMVRPDEGSIWDTRTLNDELAASGLYLVRLIQNGFSATRVLAIER